MSKQKDDIKVLTERIRSGDRVSLSSYNTKRKSFTRTSKQNLQLLNLLYADTGNSIQLVLVVFQVQENLLLLSIRNLSH